MTSRTLARVRWFVGAREAIAILRKDRQKETSDFRVKVLESMAEHWNGSDFRERQSTKAVEGKPDRTPGSTPPVD